jgi:diguanylate cyclase (GGDEF)-like protein
MMQVDYNSLLLALAVSASCLVVTGVGSWFSRRPDTFLLTCSAGLAPLVGGIFIYGFYLDKPQPIFAILTFVLCFIGFSIIWVAGHQFRTRRVSKARFVLGCSTGIAASVPAMLAGYDGLAFIGDNLVISLLLLLTAREYWLSRHEAPTPLYGITALYTLTAISFVLCAAVLIADGKLVLDHAPDNWAQNLSIAVSIAGMTGIGALSLALHQWRQAALHRKEAITDSLTGLLNRRALFDLYGRRSFGPSMAVIVFDIDRFKTINDQHGHAAGDLVLKLFGQELSVGLRASDTVARLGGEEFALVLDNTLPGRAEQVAERIRGAFAARTINIGDKSLTCTVSAGVATGTAKGIGFDDVLRAADEALYDAKRNGRNRIEVAAYLRAV